jgi:flagellar basal body-associated protein FliL
MGWVINRPLTKKEGKKLRKWIMLVAVLTLVVVAAAPAIAQVSQGFRESRITSGRANPSFNFSNSGNNVNACPTDQQIAQTGNIANEQGVTQYNTDTGDIDFSGSSITIDPSVDSSCTQSIDQVASG